jgi:hypothetical protein
MTAASNTVPTLEDLQIWRDEGRFERENGDRPRFPRFTESRSC